MGTSPFLGGARWPGQGPKLPSGGTSSDGDRGDNRAAPFEQTQPAAGGADFHLKSTQRTTTYCCRAQTRLAGRDCMLRPCVRLVTLLFSSLWMRVPKCLTLFRVPFCTLLVRPHSVLDITKKTLTPENMFWQHVVMSLFYP